MVLPGADKIRKVWHQEQWFYSVVDIIAFLTESENPRRYWSDLKRRVSSEGFDEVYAKCVRLKLLAVDGKRHLTDTANRETIFRIVQSVPSPRAEPLKLWLAEAGEQRLQTIEQNYLTVDAEYLIKNVNINRLNIKCNKMQYTEKAREKQSKEDAKRFKKRRENDLQKIYGITLEEYDQRWASQKGLCAICGNPETRLDHRSGKPKALVVDHNHDTHKVRALLCHSCNLMIGHAKESVERLTKGAVYLNHYNNENMLQTDQENNS
jgi:hypothetical protein